GCGLYADREKIAGRRRSSHQPAALRLLLLGFVCPGLAVVRARQGKSAGAARNATQDRRSGERKRRNRRNDLNRRATPPPPTHGSSRHRIRLSATRERNLAS